MLLSNVRRRPSELTSTQVSWPVPTSQAAVRCTRSSCAKHAFSISIASAILRSADTSFSAGLTELSHSSFSLPSYMNCSSALSSSSAFSFARATRSAYSLSSSTSVEA